MRLRRLARPSGIDLEASLDTGDHPEPPSKRKTRYRRPNGHARLTPQAARHKPSPEMRKTISNMASYGLDPMMIAKLAGISANTIYTHYRHEMQTSAAQKDLLVLQSAFLKAIGGPEQDWEKADGAMQRWWIGVRQRWALPAQTTVNANFNMDLTRLSDRELEQLERIMESAAMDDRGRPPIEGQPLQSED